MHHFCSSIRGCSFFLPRNRRCRRLLSFSPGPPVLPLVPAATPSPGGGRVRLRSTAGVRGVPAAILGTCMLCAVYTTINVQQQQQQQQTTMTTKEEKKNTTSVEYRWTSSGIDPTHKTRMLTTQCEKDNNTNNTNNRRNVDDDVDRNNPDHRPLFFELTEKIGSELRNLQGMANTLTTTTTTKPQSQDRAPRAPLGEKRRGEQLSAFAAAPPPPRGVAFAAPLASPASPLASRRDSDSSASVALRDSLASWQPWCWE